MKKIIFTLIVIMALTAGVGYCETHYSRDAIATQYCDGIATFWDGAHYWDVKTDNIYNRNDRVELKMFTSFTNNNVYDDEVIEIIKK
jgi:hypothetical protein